MGKKLVDWFKAHPKVTQTFLVAAGYAAGSQGGAPAANAVHVYGPYVLSALAKVLGG